VPRSALLAFDLSDSTLGTRDDDVPYVAAFAAYRSDIASNLRFHFASTHHHPHTRESGARKLAVTPTRFRRDSRSNREIVAAGYDPGMISLRAVSKVYPSGAAAVDGISLDVDRGETLVLLGASGCGKTTTLKMINRLVEPSGGEIRVEGRDVSELDADALRRRIGYVFQGIGLFPHHSVGDNIAAVPRLLGWERGRIAERVDALLDLVGLPHDEYRERRPHELSGGQQQRVGVARAIAAESKLLLMDEPFGALDPITRDDLQSELIRMRAQLGLTIVLVTHDVTEALLLADRVAVLDHGRLLQLGTPAELFAAPADPKVERLLATPRRQADRLQALAQMSPEPAS
jgi:osmoprotectant transport system ATP-binding protein